MAIHQWNEHSTVLGKGPKALCLTLCVQFDWGSFASPVKLNCERPWRRDLGRDNCGPSFLAKPKWFSLPRNFRWAKTNLWFAVTLSRVKYRFCYKFISGIWTGFQPYFYALLKYSTLFHPFNLKCVCHPILLPLILLSDLNICLQNWSFVTAFFNILNLVTANLWNMVKFHVKSISGDRNFHEKWFYMTATLLKSHFSDHIPCWSSYPMQIFLARIILVHRIHAEYVFPIQKNED